MKTMMLQNGHTLTELFLEEPWMVHIKLMDWMYIGCMMMT
uniref:Uncharacterized protein n=1 Tax=viral metagenome TaxID=1070528 RepID=A0A6C0B2T7_9ZZZZ